MISLLFLKYFQITQIITRTVQLYMMLGLKKHLSVYVSLGCGAYYSNKADNTQRQHGSMGAGHVRYFLQYKHGLYHL